MFPPSLEYPHPILINNDIKKKIRISPRIASHLLPDLLSLIDNNIDMNNNPIGENNNIDKENAIQQESSLCLDPNTARLLENYVDVKGSKLARRSLLPSSTQSNIPC